MLAKNTHDKDFSIKSFPLYIRKRSTNIPVSREISLARMPLEEVSQPDHKYQHHRMIRLSSKWDLNEEEYE